MLLKNLIKKTPDDLEEIKITGLALDSRNVKKGNLFFAFKGTELNGENFIDDAIKKGAKAIICNKKLKKKHTVPIILVKDIKKILAYACSKFYKHKPKNIIAVTGTNGKSSVAEFFRQILVLNKISVASIGTLGIKKNKKIKKINLTSPDIITLHRELEILKKSNIDNVIIEASSHGLQQGRLDNIDFKAGIFTNFSQDHLDYHKTMKNYFKSKKILFSRLIKKNNYLISDAEINEFKALKQISKKKKLKILTINKRKIIDNLSLINLIGSFQIKNLCMAILAANVCGLKLNRIKSTLNRIVSVDGRLQLTRTLSNKTKIFIDYAHTPDALLTAVKTLKEYYGENINLVFGCGGERDIKKRPLMAKIANKYCKKVYITDDNPRNENPKKIRRLLINNIARSKVIEIPNRTKCIQSVIQNSKPLEVILIAGKGHETIQDYGIKKLNISDKRIVNKTKFKQKKITNKELNYEWNSEIIQKIMNKKNTFKFQGVSINSKNVKKNNLFIAVKGKKKDGHNYLPQAIKRGASYCVVSKKLKNIKTKKLIKCINTNNFLRTLAMHKRIKSKAKIVAITGSSGKTTNKALLGNLLALFNNTYFSPKSYNNHFGVPISLSNLERSHKCAVLEVGMNKPGEIHNLSKLISPDIAIITNVAAVHIENFKNLKGIAKAKGEIINNIKKKGSVVLNRDDKFYNYFKSIANKRKIKVVSFGLSKKSDVHPIYNKRFQNKRTIKLKVLNEKISLKVNDINIYNILSSLAVLKILNFDISQTKKYFLFLNPLEGRGKTHDVKRFKTNFKLIDESYNANPFSVKNAVIKLSKIKLNNSKKYILLGDMLELGRKSDILHKNLSKIINNADIDKIFVYGKKVLNTYKYTNKHKRGNILQSVNDFDEVFSKIIKRNDYLMIKGSNATGLNKLSNRIIKGYNHVV